MSLFYHELTILEMRFWFSRSPYIHIVVIYFIRGDEIISKQVSSAVDPHIIYDVLISNLSCLDLSMISWFDN